MERPPYVLLVFPTAGSQWVDIGANKVVDVASRLTCLECGDVNGETKRLSPIAGSTTLGIAGVG